jgi:hypothetical protein
VQGVREGATSSEPLALPASEPPAEPTTASGQLTSRELLRPKRAARRAQSFDRAAGAAGGHCLACHTANLGHARHLRSGDCVGFPGSSFYRRQEAPAPEPAQPLPALQEPTEAQTLDDKAADDATKLTPPSSYNSAYDGTAAPTTGDQSGGKPSDRPPGLDPSGGPPSDGPGDRSGGKPSDRAPGQVSSGGLPSDGLGRASASAPQYGNELSDAIQSLTSVVEGLSTTVKNLQESVERLSGRVEQVEFEWAFRRSGQVQDEFPDSNTTPHHTMQSTTS